MPRVLGPLVNTQGLVLQKLCLADSAVMSARLQVRQRVAPQPLLPAEGLAAGATPEGQRHAVRLAVVHQLGERVEPQRGVLAAVLLLLVPDVRLQVPVQVLEQLEPLAAYVALVGLVFAVGEEVPLQAVRVLVVLIAGYLEIETNDAVPEIGL